MADPSLERINTVIRERLDFPSALVAVLQGLQEEFGYIPPEAFPRIQALGGWSLGRIMGVATFYSSFRLRPVGRHMIRVCFGTACHVKGAGRVYDSFRRVLGIAEEDDTDPEGIFTLEKVACLGCCMLAPAVRIGEITYGPVEPGQTGKVLRDFLSSAGSPERERRKPSGDLPRGTLRLCTCSSCEAAGAGKVFRALEEEILRLSLRVTLESTGCPGTAYDAPVLDVIKDSWTFRYALVEPRHVRGILEAHFKAEKVIPRVKAAVDRLLDRIYSGGEEVSLTRYARDVRFHGKGQDRIATAQCGELPPLDFEAYRDAGGWAALERCYTELSPEEVIDEIEASGLRGRGGAGFPTGKKWRLLGEKRERTYIICNGDEGDPGAFMDRMLLESFPFRVIEGFLIAAYATGAGEGFFYVRAEYPLAVKRLKQALKICETRGLFRDRLKIHVVQGAGAFVCGEETALIRAVEGLRGMPRSRPPYPSEKGLWGKPTLVNNVETLSLVSWILRYGAQEFRRRGTSLSPGTKTFALAGKIRKSGLIEVPLGITVNQIVFTIGGGIQGGRSFKALQIGGPSGGCLPASLGEIPVDYESLEETGGIMGSGGLVVLDEGDCMVDLARYFLAFSVQESCGKCTFCRIGIREMLEILERICRGEGKVEDLEELETLGKAVSLGSLCGLGRRAPAPVLSTLRYFRQEYVDHINGKCPGGKCGALIRYHITDECIGCSLCAGECPVEAIPAMPYRRHHINEDICIRCGACRIICPAGAVIVE